MTLFPSNTIIAYTNHLRSHRYWNRLPSVSIFLWPIWHLLKNNKNLLSSINRNLSLTAFCVLLIHPQSEEYMRIKTLVLTCNWHRKNILSLQTLRYLTCIWAKTHYIIFVNLLRRLHTFQLNFHSYWQSSVPLSYWCFSTTPFARGIVKPAPCTGEWTVSSVHAVRPWWDLLPALHRFWTSFMILGYWIDSGSHIST